MSEYVGLNKSGFASAVCVISGRGTEVLLKERLSRIKHDGGSIDELIRLAAPAPRARIAETSYFHRPERYERRLDARAPYLDSARTRGLARFRSALNPELRFLPHHYCHARAAAATSPFRRALIVVQDGGGSFAEAFPADHPERAIFPADARGRRTEAWSAYLQEGDRLACVAKEWQRYHRIPGIEPERLGEGLGSFYDLAALYIFGSRHEAGKVMGLAPFGRARPVIDRVDFHRALDWRRSFAPAAGSRWPGPGRGRFAHFADVAASVQRHFEDSLLALLERLRERFPGYPNLILTGGCALNCVANAKVVDSGRFREVYVPAAPGDEGVAFGAAAHLRAEHEPGRWRPCPPAAQTASFGPRASVPDARQVREAFAGCRVSRPRDLAALVASRLAAGQVIGWFQGRSESGPRALGARSLLAAPGIPGMQARLNATVKEREEFRPYGCATLWERAAEYFSVPPGFDGPFMSFAPRVRPRYRRALAQVTHVDGTCRIQTVRERQDPAFYRLIAELGRRTGVACVLNTSLNRMDEPIVETVADAARFLARTPIEGIAIGAFLVEPKHQR